MIAFLSKLMDIEGLWYPVKIKLWKKKNRENEVNGYNMRDGLCVFGWAIMLRQENIIYVK